MTNQGIFLNPSESIPYSQTNLPKDHFVFKDRLPIYWLVELNRVPGDRKVNKVHVKDYGFKTIGSFNHQVRMREIPFLKFEKLDSESFRGLCEFCELPFLEGLISTSPEPTPENEKSLLYNLASNTLTSNGLPISKEFTVELRVSFSDATIIDGAIAFAKKIEEVDRTLEFKIANPFLKASYETIKDYFAKKLQRKFFSVKARIRLIDREVVVVEAHSEEIDRINESFIQAIKYKQIHSLVKIKKSDERQIYSIDELLLLSDELKGNLLQTNIENIIQVLTNDFKHRNSRQLSYLAKEHDLEEIIYLTVSPYFGFLFSLRDRNRQSYIWELLDSHATYIWSFVKEDRNKQREFDMIEQSINQIRQGGRNAYKNKYRNGEINVECRFDTIQHVMDGQGADKMFDEWLAELKTKTEQQELE